ncbi:MAG: hypothetical protein M1827_000269 [Pycnora praestabilis]|nr:MAG: hypothetical protein M1827_000269 [Pycnora praestabilis]
MSSDLQPQPREEKFSRYRSVRKAAARRAPVTSPPPVHGPVSPTLSDPMEHSKSRYRRARPPISSLETQEPLPPIPTQQQYQQLSPSSITSQEWPSSSPGRDPSGSPKVLRAGSAPSPHVDRVEIPRARTVKEPCSFERSARRERQRQEDRSKLHAQHEQSRDPASQSAGLQNAQDGVEELNAIQRDLGNQREQEERVLEEARRIEGERAQLLKEIKRRELERLEKELDAAKPSSSPPKIDQSRDKLGLFSRLKADKGSPPTSPDMQQSQCTFTQGDRQAHTDPGGLGTVRGVDAPVSAVNAGERRVLVRYNQSAINLPITPTTTPVDLIYSAANCLGQGIQPKSSVLLESFSHLGLERPIRNYEHIRDIMNSWDRDAQNSLNLVSSATNGDDDDLEVKAVPKKQMEDISFRIYHLQKPHKWDKRWITLRPDGQMLVSKTSNAGDGTNICHLSDFDIYTPTPRQSKKIKAPKKLCFAIKSQQKSSMFLSTANYVHFFAINDKTLAASWYKAVQGWRSWYLVNVMGEGQKQEIPDFTGRANSMAGIRRNSISKRSLPTQHTHKTLVDSAPYQSGSFGTLIDAERLNQASTPLESLLPTRQTSIKAVHTRNVSLRQKTNPPVSFPRRLARDRTESSSILSPQTLQDQSEEPTFAQNGLLGWAYSQRQRAQPDRETSSNDHPGPPHRASVDEGSRPARAMSIRSRQDSHSPPKRSTSQHPQPKPLVDLTPEYREPPQHVRKGRGVKPEEIPPGGLIGIATTPDVAILIPPSTAWRRPVSAGNGGGNSTPKGESFPKPGISRSGRPQTANSNSTSSADKDGTFSGLVGRKITVHGNPGHGRAVTNGAYAKAPMVDISEQSKFVTGSLLAKVDKTGAV